MCQALPGPRCTPHALNRLEKQRQLLNEALTDFARIKNGRTSPKKKALEEKILNMNDKVFHAERDYYSTPGGIAELQDKLKTKMPLAERTQFQSQLEIGQLDRDSHLLAGSVYKQMKKKLTPADLELRNSLLLKERESNIRLSEAKNDSNTPQEIERLQQEAQQARKNRVRYEEALRVKSVGVEKMININAEYCGKKDNAFILLQSYSFGRVKNYIPFGAYARIENIEPTSEGNIQLTLEGGISRIVAKSSPVSVGMVR